MNVLIIVLHLVAMVAVGLRAGRRAHDAEDYRGDRRCASST